MIKIIGNNIVQPLCNIINKSLITGTVPNNTKIAKIIPLFKNKDNRIMSNYRSISLLLSIFKIIEKVLHSRLTEFMNTNNLFYDKQFGFRPSFSTYDAIIKYTSELLNDKNKLS